VDTANSGARVLVRRRCNRAGIENDDLCLDRRRRALQAAFGELALDGSAIGLGRATAKILYVKAAHGYIVTYRHEVFCAARLTATKAQFAASPGSTYEVVMKRRILLVDDDVAVLLTLKAVLEMHGFEIDTAHSVPEAVSKLAASVYQMVITDMRMETETAGLQVIQAAKAQRYRPATAMLTAYPPLDGEWKESGAQSVLVKPVGTKDLVRQIEALLVSHEDQKQREGALASGTIADAGISAPQRRADKKAS
jgi:CheY-like chemotaxis protein